jgi:hypothetical protein
MWTYSQTSGELVTPENNGYSGCGEGLNNPLAQNLHDVGPIPQGDWTIGKFFNDPGGKGPIVAHLYPGDGTETYGRTGFYIHGDNEAMNHTASEGCIILERAMREAIATSGDNALHVIP